jgi:uncharacterized membrane protein required for colicin V production
MDDYLVLDILLGLIVVLFAAIGCWRGAAKEVVVTAGIFAGAALASSWAKPWGSDVVDLTGLRADVAQLVVAATALLTATIVLGYAGSALIGSPTIPRGERLVGGALAAINGLVLLHYLLSFVEQFVTDAGAQRALVRSQISRQLLRQFGWLLIGAAGVVATAIVVGLLLQRRRRFAPLVLPSDFAEPAFYHETVGRHRPARLPRGADDGKYEPIARGYDATSGRYADDAPVVGQTIPLPPVDAAGFAHGGGRGGPSSNGPQSDSPPETFAGDEWYRRVQGVTRASSSGHDQSDRGALPASSDRAEETGRVLHEPGANGYDSTEDVSALSWIRRSAHPGWIGDNPASTAADTGNTGTRQCRACAAELGESDGFCPRCGTPT